MNKEILNQIKDDIKSRLSIVDLISENVSLEPAGKDFKGLCPFHEEKTASFVVSDRKRYYKCYGCEKWGDVFSFIQETQNIPFKAALRQLAKRVGVKVPGYSSDDYEPDSSEFNEFNINEIAANYFHLSY